MAQFQIKVTQENSEQIYRLLGKYGYTFPTLDRRGHVKFLDCNYKNFLITYKKYPIMVIFCNGKYTGGNHRFIELFGEIVDFEKMKKTLRNYNKYNL